MKLKVGLYSIGLIGGLLLVLLALWPGAFEPVAWDPPGGPSLSGPYAPNTALSAVERFGTGVDFGPDDTAFDALGRIVAGMEHGRIVRFEPEGDRYTALADTGGRPLGLAYEPSGDLVVADARRGLLSISSAGRIRVLATEAGGLAFGLTNDVDVARDGTIYFSDATSKFSIDTVLLDAFEHGAHGRLLAYEPQRHETRVLLEGLAFANGVALNPDQSFVLVCETWKYRIRRYWLKGPQKGQSDTFIENLPGFPDNVSSNGRDTFWLALYACRDRRFDALLPHPLLRKILFRLGSLPAELPPYGLVLGLDQQGRVIHNLQDPDGSYYAPITSAEEHGGMLYLGSIEQDSIGRLPLR